MKKRLFVLGLAVCAIVGSSLSIYAQAKAQTPAEVLAQLSNQTVESITAERREIGKTYGAMAAEMNQLEAFHAANLTLKKERIQGFVNSGQLTAEQAEAIINKIEANQENCDGTGRGNREVCGLNRTNNGACGTRSQLNSCNGTQGIQRRGQCRTSGSCMAQ